METVWIVLTQLVLLHTITVTGTVVNVALGKTAIMSPTVPGYTASTAVDGNTDTTGFGVAKIIDTGKGNPAAWWKVDLQREVQDATVRIFFRTPYTWRRNGVELYTSTISFPNSNPTSQGQLCHTVTGDPSGSDIPDVYSVTCPGRWRYLLLYTDTDNINNGASTGPSLDFGEVEVLACSAGTYGEDCTKTCSSSKCVTMTTTCERDGRCPDSCLSGWTGMDCTQACSDGTYGEDCTKTCSSRNCVTMTTTCERDGRCSDGCQILWMGIDCTQLTPCNNINQYGLNCDKLCSDRKCKAPPSSSCDRLTGRCDNGCEDGWKQEDCTQECDICSYGPGCSLNCTARKCRNSASSCHHADGQCVNGCQPGYKGKDCIDKCDIGLYGSGCTFNCTARKCRNPAGTCPHADGRCVNGCQPGYKGTDCIDKCDFGFYEDGCILPCIARKCSVNSTVCNHVTGQCEGDCQAGYKGTDCIQACNQGINYGVNCIKSCSDRRCIQPSSVCDTKTGQCSGGCQVGWKGVDCTSQCPAGTFGSDCTSCSTRHCQGESDCPADGTCSQGCQDGWAGNTCTQTCPAGNYGPGCSLTCGQCIGDNICNYVTGNCPGDCQAGWRGPPCKQECVGGQYGVNCAQRCGQCNGTCDQVLGHCPDGCLHGFCGLRCDVKLADTNDVNIAAVVTGTVLGSLLLVFLLVFVCLIRQGRLQWVKSSEDRKPYQMSRDSREMSTIARQAADDSEHAHRSSHTYNNDYDVLEQEQMPGNKDYDIIQHKEYENA